MKFFSKISASHYVLPKKALSNEELSERFGEKKVRGISKLSGISERRVADENVTAVDLGAEAAARLIAEKGIDASSFDMLVFVSSTGDHILPQSASIVHERLGFPESCGAFDMVLGCPAFPYGMGVANGLVASGQCSKILLVFADTVTKLVNPRDRGLVTLHGDGAAVFVIEKSESGEGVEFVETGADSSGWKHLLVPAGGMRMRCGESTKIDREVDAGSFVNDENLQMNGAAVFHFSISKIPGEISKALEKHGAKMEDFDLLLLHQANRMMLDQIYAKLEVPEEKRFFFMEKIGNLGASSTPVLLAEALRSGKIKDNARVLLCSFGAGLSWGTCAVKFGDVSRIAASAGTEY